MFRKTMIHCIQLKCSILGAKEIVQLLIEKGADVDSRNIYDQTPPLQEAAVFGKFQLNLLEVKKVVYFSVCKDVRFC